MNRRSKLKTLVAVATVFMGMLLVAPRSEAADLSGCWEGRWMSCNTGHNGVLRATFCQVSPSAYQVDFSGRFFKVFPFRYSVVLNVVEDSGDVVRLQGNSYLGRMFGTFYYSATVTSGQFNASYTSCKDNGWFRMTQCYCH
jgi:hypothetical protein